MASPLCLYYLKRRDVVICDYVATILLLYEAPPSGQENKQFCKLDLWRPELLAKHRPLYTVMYIQKIILIVPLFLFSSELLIKYKVLSKIPKICSESKFILKLSQAVVPIDVQPFMLLQHVRGTSIPGEKN